MLMFISAGLAIWMWLSDIKVRESRGDISLIFKIRFHTRDSLHAYIKRATKGHVALTLIPCSLA